MKIRAPRGIKKHQIFVVIALGVITGVYTWKDPLYKYREEIEQKAQGQKSDDVSEQFAIAVLL